MKIACIYHSVDLDGWMSAAIIKRSITEEFENEPLHTYDYGVELIEEFPNELCMIGYNYGNPIPDLNNFDKVIMADISLPQKDMLALRQKLGNNFIWIDHHISAINDNMKTLKELNISGNLNTKFAACELTWQFFYPSEHIPEIVRLLGRYDCFGHKGTDEEQKVLEFQYGARTVIKDYQTAGYWLEDELKELEKAEGRGYAVMVIHRMGKSVYKYLKTEAEQIYKNAFPMRFKEISGKLDEKGSIATSTNHNFLVVNRERFNPINFGIDYHKDGYDGFGCFWMKDGNWYWSLYNDNGKVDCSLIARSFGGGGHKGAAGFVLTRNEFNSMF
jgi:oligoribonuclease NrnB/cAMP/cGMP phosphodiesterase (DHH superfamily)